MRSRLTLLVIVSVLACKPSEGYDQSATSPWMTGQTVSAGSCSYLLENAYLAHEYDWAGGAKITVTNEGEEETRCAWDVLIVSGRGKAMGSRKGWAGSLGAGSENSTYVDVSTSYTNEGETEGTWLYLGVHEGWSPTAEDGWHVVDPAKEPAY